MWLHTPAGIARTIAAGINLNLWEINQLRFCCLILQGLAITDYEMPCLMCLACSLFVQVIMGVACSQFAAFNSFS